MNRNNRERLNSEQFQQIMNRYVDNDSSTTQQTRLSISQTVCSYRESSETSFGSYRAISTQQSTLPPSSTAFQHNNNINTNGVGNSPYIGRMPSGTTNLDSRKNSLTLIPNTMKPKQNSTPNKTYKLKPAKYLILNFKKFDKINGETLKTRDGSRKDVKELEKSFKSLQMTGKICEDLKLKELEKEMNKISTKDFSQYSAIVIAVMSHGEKSSTIYAKDGIFGLYPTIIQKLLRNESLSDIPKIIFVEACKGNQDPRWDRDTNSSGSGVLIFYAAFESYVSYRDPLKGSYFTQSLCEHLQKMGKTKPIREICDAVIKDVFIKTQKTQTPTIETNLVADYCFGTYC